MNDTESKTDPKDNETPNSAEASTAPAAAETPEVVEDTAEPTLEEKLAAAQQAAAAAKDAQLRAAADLENFRRRTVREKDELRAFAAARIVEELLPVVDNLGFAIAAAKAPNAELKALADGVEMVSTQFTTALGNHGLKTVNPVGGEFDPNLHEALSQQPSDTVAEGHVLQVVRIGYTLNGRLLRPASVIVSGGAAPSATTPASAVEDEKEENA
jgi:molecular chaperone GrpE